MKESSDLEGPKPIVIDQATPEQLGMLLGQLQIWGGKGGDHADSEIKDSAQGEGPAAGQESEVQQQ